MYDRAREVQPPTEGPPGLARNPPSAVPTESPLAAWEPYPRNRARFAGSRWKRFMIAQAVKS